MFGLVGNKNSFAIEYASHPENKYIMGNIRLWIAGKYIGAINDTNILTAILLQLESLNPDNIDGKLFSDMNPEEVYIHIENDENDDSGKYYFTPGEAFDDFSVRVFALNNKLNFIWKLNDEPYFDYPTYPEGIQSAQVSIDEYRKVVKEFKEKLVQE